jgi:xylan 1,4-beta-xylosidase
LRKPQGGKLSASAPGLSDDFTKDRMGVQWSFHAPKRDEGSGRAMALAADHRGERSFSSGSSPLTCLVGDRGYEAEVSIDLTGKVEAGLLLFYNYKAFVGVGFTPEKLKIYEYSEELPWAAVPHQARSLRLRITNDENVVTWHYSHDEGQTGSAMAHGWRFRASITMFLAVFSACVWAVCRGRGRGETARFSISGEGGEDWRARRALPLRQMIFPSDSHRSSIGLS